MRQFIDYSDLLNNPNFIAWFLMTNFPEGLDETSDCTIAEMIEEDCMMDTEWVDNLTGYYEGVFDDNDGYIDNPKTIKLLLATGDICFIEFHPGDTLYFINDEEIGCTGPDYSIRKIELLKFQNYSKDMDLLEKLLLLPMLKVRAKEKRDVYDMITSILTGINPEGCNIKDICACILNNCCE